MKYMFFILLLLSSAGAYTQSATPAQYRDDFNYFWTTVNDYYCYFNKKPVNWPEIKTLYVPVVDTVSSRSSFVSVMEKVLSELYDHHCSLGTNSALSRRLVPTGTDLWAAFVNGRPQIQEVRRGFGAERAGIAAGMEVVAVNDVPIKEAIRPFTAHTIDTEALSYALRVVLAGDHTGTRKITLKQGTSVTDFYPDKDSLMLENISYNAAVIDARYGDVGYIRVNNYLFNNSLIGAFDSALDRQLNQKALILDLRETPSGGNTTVARAILGRFINREQFYQKHELYAEEKETGIKRSWEEIVSPRGRVYSGPLVVLADHWTGSIAEGITIAFDGMKRAVIIGTSLAGLNGSVETFEMPNTHIRFNIPTERLYHVDGLPRELFRPAIQVELPGYDSNKNKDVFVESALKYLKRKMK